MGKITIKGLLNIHQFWPGKKSDADTSQFDLPDGLGSISFTDDQGHTKNVGALLYQADIKSSGTPKAPVIKNQNQKLQHLTVRYQGIDATELHYKFYDPATLHKFKDSQPFKDANIEYRQKFSETAAIALFEILKPFADTNGNVPCSFVSLNIHKPGDICDVYGRFVGDFILEDSKKTNVNHELLRNGFVMPSFYDSILDNELTELIAAYQQGLAKKQSPVNSYIKEILDFDYSLVFRTPGSVPDPAKDKGQFNYPKIYRRLCQYSILKKAKLNSNNNKESFEEYLNNLKKDACIERKDLAAFRKLSPTEKEKFPGLRRFTDFIKQNAFSIPPEDFIVIEKPSSLVDKDTNQPIDNF